jgi:hypothetical protein
MKSLLVLLITLFCSGGLAHGSESQTELQPTRHAKVAILAMHEPREIAYYDDLRRRCYTAWSLRVARGLDQTVGLRIDGNPWTFRLVALGLLFLLTVGLFIGFLKRPWRVWAYGSSFGCILLIIAWIWVYSGVASLNQIDIKGAHHVQSILDSTTAWGLDTEIFWEWEPFLERWEDSNEQPFMAVFWMGIPLGADEMKMEQWMGTHRDLPILQVCLGAHLPKRFQAALFDTPPELDWTPTSSISVCEPETAYQRAVHWTTPTEKNSSMRIAPWGNNQILYGRVDVESAVIGRWIQTGLDQIALPWASLDLSGVAALRCDDPGSALNAYLETWRFPALSGKAWQEVDQVLAQFQASMSIGVVPHWLDDGDKKRGTLSIKGKMLEQRVAGKSYLSRDVHYQHLQAGTEYRVAEQIETIKTTPRLEPELHGSTHITPQVERWLKAPNRDENPDWYREFLGTEQRPFLQREDTVQNQILDDGLSGFQQTFGFAPTTMIPPGHAISWDTAELCFQKGLQALCDRHLVLNVEGHVRRSRHLHSAEISTEPQPDNLAKVLILHDRDLHLHGATWLTQQLSKWKTAGVERFVALREMVSMIASTPKLRVEGNELVIVVPELEDVLLKGLNGKESISVELHGFSPEINRLPSDWTWSDARLHIPLTGKRQTWRSPLTARSTPLTPSAPISSTPASSSQATP